MTEKEEQTWKECLGLWHTMSTIPTKHMEDGPTEFKNYILNLQGVDNRMNGCPFCATYFHNAPKCSGCPIHEDGDLIRHRTLACYDTPFGAWEERMSNDHMHDQVLAMVFYNYLLELHSRQQASNNDEVTEQLADWINTMPIAECIVEHLIDKGREVTLGNAQSVWYNELGHLAEDLGS